MTTKIEQTDLALQYTCVDENSGKLVYSYYNKMLSIKEAQSFEEHLLFCFSCQEIVFTLDSIFDAIRANREQLLGPAKQPKIKSIIKIECTE